MRRDVAIVGLQPPTALRLPATPGARLTRLALNQHRLRGLDESVHPLGMGSRVGIAKGCVQGKKIGRCSLWMCGNWIAKQRGRAAAGKPLP
jgi:hypothetical protein